jgi:hypothetical protein
MLLVFNTPDPATHASSRHQLNPVALGAGDCYLGKYQADLPNGIGVYLFEKGQKYMGEWDNGKKHGMCALMPARNLAAGSSCTLHSSTSARPPSDR